jgi:hypothetical protein
MLHVPVGANSYGLTLPSQGTTRPATAQGTSVTPATAAFGAWARVQNAISYDAYGILLVINSNTQSNNSRNTVVNIGIDSAGGTNYTVIIPDLLGGGATTFTTPGNGVWYYFPILIPRGSTIAAQARSTVTTALRVAIQTFQQPPNPSMIRKGSFVTDFGVTNTAGTTVVGGTTAEGAWTTIGTTTGRYWWWQAGVQISTADTAFQNVALELDISVGNATNKDIIIQNLTIVTTTAEQMSNPPLSAGVEWDVPSGTTIYARLQSSGNLDAYQVAVYGLGG